MGNNNPQQQKQNTPPQQSQPLPDPIILEAEITEVEPTPLRQILNEMEKVANGGSVTVLRNMIFRLTPEVKVDAQVFLTTLLRLRNAGEVAYQTCNEAVAAVMNR